MSIETRMERANTVDVRAVATRARLTEAYIDAVEQHSGDISVSRLAQLAGVGRSTFYTHFATIEDLAASVVGDLFRRTTPLDLERRSSHELSRSEITRRSLEQLIDNLWAGRALFVYAVGLPAGPAIQQRIIAELAEAARDVVLAEQPDLSKSDLRLTTNFIAGGVIQLILIWLSEPTIDREEVVEKLMTLLPPWMT